MTDSPVIIFLLKLTAKYLNESQFRNLIQYNKYNFDLKKTSLNQDIKVSRIVLVSMAYYLPLKFKTY